jgi:hypothetical protein
MAALTAGTGARRRVRKLVAAAFGVAGLVLCMGAAASAFLTFATNDYRPILIKGLWEGIGAMVAFHGMGIASQGSVARALAVLGWLATLCAVGELLDRLTRSVY